MDKPMLPPEGGREKGLPAVPEPQAIPVWPRYEPEETYVPRWARGLVGVVIALSERLVDQYITGGVPRMITVLAWGAAVEAWIWALLSGRLRKLRLAAFFGVGVFTAGLFGAEVHRAIVGDGSSHLGRPSIVAGESSGTETSGNAPEGRSTTVEVKIKILNIGQQPAKSFHAIAAVGIPSALSDTFVNSDLAVVNPIASNSTKELSIGKLTLTCKNDDPTKCDQKLFLYLKTSYVGVDEGQAPYVEEFWYTHILGTNILADASPDEVREFEPFARRAIAAKTRAQK